MSTYINSGNVLFKSEINDKATLQKKVEGSIEKTFGFFVEVLLISAVDFKKVIANAPQAFGSKPNIYYSDVAFLLNATGEDAIKEFQINPEVDAIWAGKNVVYYQRLGEKRTKSKIKNIISKPIYKQMTIRSWNTVMKLAARIDKM